MLNEAKDDIKSQFRSSQKEAKMAHGTGKSHENVPVPIRADTSHLSTNDMRVFRALLEAVRLVNPVYLKQMNQDTTQETGSFMFDKSRGNNFYPAGMTHADIEAYLKQYPHERKTILSPFTVVEKVGDRLYAVPYSNYYRRYFKLISSRLEEAARLTSNVSFQTFLSHKAYAFCTNDYYESDVDWVRVSGALLEITIGPYKSYEDSLFGVKRDVEGVLGVVLPKETASAQMYQEQVARFDAALGSRYGYTAETTLTPMIVIDEAFAAGHPYYGYVPMAYNLPNEAEIHKTVGSKKVFIRNVMNAKMELITQRIAERVLDRHTAELLEPSVFMNFVIGHESSHGISFRFSGEEFLQHGALLEEGKADVFGLLFLYFLANIKIITEDVAERAVIGHITDGLRQIRFGLDEAHAVGTLVQYNWLLKHGALRFRNDRLYFNIREFKSVLSRLGDALFTLSQTRDPVAAERFIGEWGRVPDEVRAMIERLIDIPVDIEPVFDF